MVLSTNCLRAGYWLAQGVIDIWNAATFPLMISFRDTYGRHRNPKWSGFYLDVFTRKRLLLGSDCNGLPRQDSARERQ